MRGLVLGRLTLQVFVWHASLDRPLTKLASPVFVDHDLLKFLPAHGPNEPLPRKKIWRRSTGLMFRVELGPRGTGMQYC